MAGTQTIYLHPYTQVAEHPAAGTIGVLTPEEKEKLAAKMTASSPPATKASLRVV